MIVNSCIGFSGYFELIYISERWNLEENQMKLINLLDFSIRKLKFQLL